MKWLASTLVLVVCLAMAPAASADQTIVFFRHGEKPSSGLGQITCQGLNRALALAPLLISRFGRPDYLYAPNPNQKIIDPGGDYYYVRPLATLEPVAIRAGKSVNTSAGYKEIGALESLLILKAKSQTTIFVAWEHQYLVKAVQAIMNKYGGRQTVPAWTSGDYDALYIVNVNYDGSSPVATFRRESQGLNGMPTTCPQ